jgi:hypothetical protein
MTFLFDFWILALKLFLVTVIVEVQVHTAISQGPDSTINMKNGAEGLVEVSAVAVAGNGKISTARHVQHFQGWTAMDELCSMTLQTSLNKHQHKSNLFPIPQFKKQPTSPKIAIHP